ncbi:hypothetical protein AALP_AA6G066300 [Arabis alpina]|uniref:TFIIS N-terminal domain-containing protein n=1 Tax=Arabis alpina TaxID=50452 RepID=A0A087GMI4_ARAAL|nr:hypothetical protein AALP_AA6G066300 [Arabis alpina]
MKKKIEIAREKRPDLHRLVSSAIKAANSQSVDRCVDVLRYLKNLHLSVKDLCDSKAILPLEILRDHKNHKIRSAVDVLFTSWLKTIYSSGRSDPKPKSDVVVAKVSSELKKKKNPKPRAHEVVESKQSLKKEPVVKVSVNPRSRVHEVVEIKQSLKKERVVKVSVNPRSCPALKKNSTEMLELFDMAKKSADVANAKGLLNAKAETSICVDTLSLLIGFPISSTAPETRRIMEKLGLLTKHKDRKICNSASELLHHWRQSIRDQQQGQDSRKTQV